jgi:hypothetical protein
MKIIMSNTPGPGDSHGCPFRHIDHNMLRQKLQGVKISKDGVDQVGDQSICDILFVNCLYSKKYFSDSGTLEMLSEHMRFEEKPLHCALMMSSTWSDKTMLENVGDKSLWLQNVRPQGHLTSHHGCLELNYMYKVYSTCMKHKFWQFGKSRVPKLHNIKTCA